MNQSHKTIFATGVNITLHRRKILTRTSLTISRMLQELSNSKPGDLVDLRFRLLWNRLEAAVQGSSFCMPLRTAVVIFVIVGEHYTDDKRILNRSKLPPLSKGCEGPHRFKFLILDMRCLRSSPCCQGLSHTLCGSKSGVCHPVYSQQGAVVSPKKCNCPCHKAPVLIPACSDICCNHHVTKLALTTSQ